jgi:hypothetical protein
MTSYTQKVISLKDAFPKMSLRTSAVMLTLYDVGAMKNVELQSLFGECRQTIHKSISKLEARGIATRRTACKGIEYLLTNEARDKLSEMGL